MSTPTSAPTAVVVSGGKQFPVAPGDRILVDRVAAEPGADVALDRVLLWRDGDQVKVTPEELQGVTVNARVLDHRRGQKIEVMRYKPKKRVRVRRGARADLTELEIVSVGAGSTGTSRGKAAEKAAASSSEKTGGKTAEKTAEKSSGQAGSRSSTSGGRRRTQSRSGESSASDAEASSTKESD